MVPLKRRKVPSSASSDSSPDVACKFPQVVLFLLERKMGSSRRTFLTDLCRKKGFRVNETFSESVTHVISEKNKGDDVRRWLRSQGHDLTIAHLVDIGWLTDSLRAGHPVDILEGHKLHTTDYTQSTHKLTSSGGEVTTRSIPAYACQRRTTLSNRNTIFTDALLLLAENAELSGDDGRGLAFRRGAAVLKALPEAVTDMRRLRGCPCLGEHSLRVIQDILETGVSREVESTKQSERYQAMKVLTGIFGVGLKTADQWFRDGIQNIHQLRHSGRTLNRAQQAGLAHYDDLMQPITKAEADVIANIVEEAVQAELPGSQVTLVGGFRRGNPSGHDVDFLITHPQEGREEGVIAKVVSRLEAQDFLLYQKTTRNSYMKSNDGPARPASSMDHFERCLCIFRLTTGEQHEPKACTQAPGEDSEGRASKRAVRVDLVVSPFSQVAFALLGWTGSKLFERELRRWATREKNMSLSSHALYDNKQGRYLKAATEEEIFAHLSLDYIPPSDRNT
ncbi:DNA-directed DNA/RNA polymerase mu isoform X2 [Dunckerocampus dactyliophorus]|uniref:DNA-directed DNA/RNA polymerase mu isoform X2 n=1 Tax=Dunckerocampus dactyliophorus TaxID=161453 RepID=UPI0024050AC9|nr:DNA-directed DNA/RNA polymerase mu isoform X2 [Dunckerocampus dactyliophorus]